MLFSVCINPITREITMNQSLSERLISLNNVIITRCIMIVEIYDDINNTTKNIIHGFFKMRDILNDLDDVVIYSKDKNLCLKDAVSAIKSIANSSTEEIFTAEYLNNMDKLIEVYESLTPREIKNEDDLISHMIFLLTKFKDFIILANSMYHLAFKLKCEKLDLIVK